MGLNIIKRTIEDYINELSLYNQSISELADNQYNLLNKTGATLEEYEDFLSDLKGAISPFKEIVNSKETDELN